MQCFAVCIEGWNPSDKLYEELLDLLDEKAATRIRAFRFRVDALANLIGRLLPLWHVCSLNSVRRWNSLKQDREAKGRPFLVNTDDTNKPLDYDFNISHDGNMIVMASKNPPQGVRIGIDVMRIGLPVGIPDIPEFEATVDDMISQGEKQSLMQAPIYNKLDLLLHYWTSKEAISKALGEGLSFPYAELDSTPLREHGICDVRGTPCSVTEMRCQQGTAKYMIAMAALGLSDPKNMPKELETIAVSQLVEEVRAFKRRS